MSYGLDKYGEANTQAPGGMIRMPTLKERLELAVKQAEDQLVDAKRARDILNSNPDLEELLNIMQKGRF